MINQLADGNPNVFVEIANAVDRASLNAYGGLEYGRELASYWVDKDYLNPLGNRRNTMKLRLTASGIDYLKSLQKNPA